MICFELDYWNNYTIITANEGSETNPSLWKMHRRSRGLVRTQVKTGWELGVNRNILGWHVKVGANTTQNGDRNETSASLFS